MSARRAQRLAMLATLTLSCACAAGSSKAPTAAPPAAATASQRFAWVQRIGAEPDAIARATACARELALTESFSDCQARACGPAAVVVELTRACGADSCDGRAYLLASGRAPRALPFGGHKACAADGSFAVADVQLAPASEQAFYDPRRWQVVLQRFRAEGGEPEPFANCMAPALAPDGRSFLCRDRAGSVLQVSVAGGAVHVVAEAGVSFEQLEYDPQSFLYPEPPRVIDGELRFTLQTREGPIERSAKWPAP